jgi:Zn finger protein HypA/HybF involved in hydrogenase expression
MIVRCGSCRTQFEVAGAGRFSCPACGSVNVVRNQTATGPASAGAYPTAPGAPATPTPPPSDRPSPRINCPECAFTFIVGDIAVASCPNCGTEVRTGRAVPSAPTELPEEPVAATLPPGDEDPVLTEEE